MPPHDLMLFEKQINLFLNRGESEHFENEGCQPRFLRKREYKTLFAIFWVNLTHKNDKFSNTKGVQPPCTPIEHISSAGEYYFHFVWNLSFRILLMTKGSEQRKPVLTSGSG